MQKRRQDLPSSTRTGLRLVEPTPRRAGFSKQTRYGRITRRINPDRRLPQHIKQNRMAAHPHHPGPHVRTTLQRRSRLRNAEKKDTRSDKQVCDNPETTGVEIIQHNETRGASYPLHNITMSPIICLNKVIRRQRPPLLFII